MSSPDRLSAYRERVFAERARLRAALHDCAGHQRAVLADLLAHNADTEFGRQHGFGRIRTMDEFRKAVPIRDYAGLSRWIDRTAAGVPSVLTADEPVVYFTSSGSTGEHKKIPVTARFMRTTFFPFFYAAWAPLVEHFPEAVARPDAVLNLKYDPVPKVATTASGRPHLGASQVDFGTVFGEPLSAEPGSAASWTALPAGVDAGDHLEKAYLRLRLAVAGDVRCVIGINPAVVAALPFQLREWWPRIVKEIHDGTLGGRPHQTPDPARARELSRLAERVGRVLPAHVWPNLRSVFCWTTGLAALYLPRLREELAGGKSDTPGVSVLPAPVAASEGPVAVTLDRHPCAGSPVVTAAVYEFVPADDEIGDGCAPLDTTLELLDLAVGQEYHVVISHVGGLYRYALGDVVRVVDTDGGVPRLAYAGRGGLSNVCGERLREAQVLRALAAALGAGGLDIRNAACRVRAGGGQIAGHVGGGQSAGPIGDGQIADSAGGGPSSARYEFACAPWRPWSDAETDRLAARLDVELAAESPSYRQARAAGLLAPLALCRLDGEAFLSEWHDRVRSGIRPAQAKDRLFWRDEESWHRLIGATPAWHGEDEHAHA
jgi:hypothetical protein